MSMNQFKKPDPGNFLEKLFDYISLCIYRYCYTVIMMWKTPQAIYPNGAPMIDALHLLCFGLSICFFWNCFPTMSVVAILQMWFSNMILKTICIGLSIAFCLYF